MSITKSKYDAPVRSNRDAPETFEPAFERVEPEAGKIHIRRNPCAAQNREDVFDLLDHVGLEASPLAVDKKSLQPLVSKMLDHVSAARPLLDYPTVTSNACQSLDGPMFDVLTEGALWTTGTLHLGQNFRSRTNPWGATLGAGGKF